MGNKSNQDQVPKHWGTYSNLQRQKHNLIRHYLNGWFPKMSKYHKKVYYIETHAGRGEYFKGQLGSPIVALNTLLKHRHLEEMLKQSTFTFYFIEKDYENLNHLQNALAKISIPNLQRIKIYTSTGDCFDKLNVLINTLKTTYENSFPSFIFIDPYGFKIPGKVLKELIRFKKSELLVNVIWRELNMELAQQEKPGRAQLLDSIFDGDSWRKITSPDFDERSHQAANIFQDVTGAKWETHLSMSGTNGKTRYFLLHLTNHDEGRKLMKECIWTVCPEGSFLVKKRDEFSYQLPLIPIILEPDLTPLEDWIVKQIEKKPQKFDYLKSLLINDIWLDTHFTKAINSLVSSKKIVKKCNIIRINPELSLFES